MTSAPPHCDESQSDLCPAAALAKIRRSDASTVLRLLAISRTSKDTSRSIIRRTLREISIRAGSILPLAKVRRRQKTFSSSSRENRKSKLLRQSRRHLPPRGRSLRKLRKLFMILTSSSSSPTSSRTMTLACLKMNLSYMSISTRCKSTLTAQVLSSSSNLQEPGRTRAKRAALWRLVEAGSMSSGQRNWLECSLLPSYLAGPR